ncbi:MAG: hypothetical protein AB7N80_08220 [Bdellovibrionales bacterium]
MKTKSMLLSFAFLLSITAHASPRTMDWSFRAPSLNDKNAIDPVTQGDIVFETNTNRFYGWNGSTWTDMTGGSVSNFNIDTLSGSTTLTTSEDILLGDAASASITLTLATAVGSAGKVFEVKKIDSSSNTVIVDGASTETIDGAANVVLAGQNDVIRIISDGANWRVLSRDTSYDAELYLDTGNGHGSTNNKIRRFSNTRKNTLGSFATYADSAANGMSVTINVPGVYALFYSDRYSAGAVNIGLTLNSGSLTTAIGAVTYANGKRASSTTATSNFATQIASTMRLSAGDVVRAHDDGNPNGTSDDVIFQLVRVGD